MVAEREGTGRDLKEGEGKTALHTEGTKERAREPLRMEDWKEVGGSRGSVKGVWTEQRHFRGSGALSQQGDSSHG